MPRTAGGDSLDLPIDPLQFGPISGYNLVTPRLYKTSPGGPYNVTTAKLTAATPGQAPLGEIEVFRNDGTTYETFAWMPLAGGWSFATTYPIGDFNGSSCGDSDWYYSVYDIQDTVPLVRIPSGVGLSAELRVESGGCKQPNSIVDWCTCHLATPGPIKHASGFGLWSWVYEPIVPSELLVTATPDTLGVGAAASLAVRLIDDHGYEVDLGEADGVDDATPVTLTAPADSAAARGLVLGGAAPVPGVTTTYGAARGGAVGYAAGTDSLVYDTPVTVSAIAGGYAGSGRLVLRGTGGAGPDSLVASSADPSVPCGDSTAVLVDGFLDGELRPLPDSAHVTLAVSDLVRSSVAFGGVRASELTVPAAALRDSTVHLVTQNCDDVTGEVPLAVTITVEAPWAEGGSLTTTYTVPLAPRDDALGLAFATDAVLAPGDAAQLFLDAPVKEMPVGRAE